VTAEEPDRLLDAATRLLDVVETELFTTALDLDEGGTPAPTIGTVVAAACSGSASRPAVRAPTRRWSPR
jgi:hypothetical protein